ncbi:hypothetical protein BSK59_15775 [Paenibacillus odorifer]|uniref:hypothetical protein n=1 Tax=Paenibacillus odorifer TaxID=189426 RepID=UPI00097B338D|nr:hypothetical protein [Paenibacillus odorifer]OME54039.1 hypothetical protein BSK59_15775 [Paenibacillus odorifer]
MKISGVAIGQWNQICKKKEGIRRTQYKIYRAIVMGNVAHTYASKDYIIRYHDMNILVSHTGLVLTIWRDSNTDTITIVDKVKAKYDAKTTHKQNIKKANAKHSYILKV